MATHFVLIGLVVSSALSYAWPGLTGGGFDPFLASAAWLWPLIALAMFAVGWLLPGDELRLVASRWPVVLAGTALQYVAMPMLAYAGGRVAGLEGDLLVGVILVGCVPGAMASNVLTLLARGNVSYSVCLTTTATLISPLVVPFALAVALGRQDVTFPRGQTMRDLFCYVVLPVVSGHLLGRRLVRWNRWARPFGNMLANLVILWIIAVVVAANRERLAEFNPRLMVVLLGVNLTGYLVGWLGAFLLKLPGPMSRALTLEIGMQNAGLGTTLALSLFPEHPAAAIPGALYTFGCMLTGTLLASFWSRRSAGRRSVPVSRFARKNEL